MFRSPITRWVLGAVLVIAALGVLRFKPWQRVAGLNAGNNTGQARQQLNVGFLPVT